MQQELSAKPIKTVLNWSSGKDAAMAYHILRDSVYDVKYLLTTINDAQDRVVMHGVREELLDCQAERMGIPLRKIRLPASPTDDSYSAAMTEALQDMGNQGITTAAFGDIFLTDLRQYREEQLQKIGFQAVFPLWEMDTSQLVTAISQAGIRAMIVCVNEQCLGAEFLGREINEHLLTDLPEGIDPCGEKGEFHSFVFDAPFFSSPIGIKAGELVRRQYNSEAGASGPGFLFMDIYPD